MVNTYNNTGVNAKNHIGDISHNHLQAMIKKINDKARNIEKELLVDGSIKNDDALIMKKMRRENNDYHKKGFTR